MKTNLDFELYLYQMELNFEKLNEGMWLIQDESEQLDNILVIHQAPIVLFRVKLMELTSVPIEQQEAFSKRLLELNSTLNHGSFAFEDNNVIVIDTLQAENLDFNEFQASIDDITFAITEYYPELSAFRNNQEQTIKTSETAAVTSTEELSP